jgi:hypothetical protein
MIVVSDKIAFLEYDTNNYVNNWKKFESDERTKNLVLYYGCNFNPSMVDKNKINVFWSVEHPGIYFVGKIPGQNLKSQKAMEKVSDHLITYNLQVLEYSGKNYKFCPLGYDIDYVYKQLKIDNIDKINKTIDVSMCGTNPHPDMPLNSWYEVMRNFNYSFSSIHPPGIFKSWHEKQMDIAKSKATIVWSTFWGADDASKNFANKNFPWIKFKKGPDMNRWQTPHFKYRVHDAAAMKSLILCYKGPFGNEDVDYPYRNSIEYYYKPNIDFLYFENKNHLQEILNDVCKNFHNDIKYKNMINSAHSKLIKHYKLDNIYEKFLVPLALEGK